MKEVVVSSHSWLNPESILSICAFLLTIGSYMYLCVLVAREKEDSSTVTWTVAAVLTAIQFAGQMKLGGAFALAISASQLLGILAILLVTVRRYTHNPAPSATGLRRYVGPVATSDWGMLVVSLAVTAVYLHTSSPRMAIVLALAADAAGMLPTVRLAYSPQDGFPLSPWWIDAVAGMMGVGAVVIGDGLRMELLALPAYLVIINLAVVGSYHAGQRQRKTPHLATASGVTV